MELAADGLRGMKARASATYSTDLGRAFHPQQPSPDGPPRRTVYGIGKAPWSALTGYASEGLQDNIAVERDLAGLVAKNSGDGQHSVNDQNTPLSPSRSDREAVCFIARSDPKDITGRIRPHQGSSWTESSWTRAVSKSES